MLHDQASNVRDTRPFDLQIQGEEDEPRFIHANERKARKLHVYTH